MTDSIIPLQLILVAQVWIYLPLPLMIYPAHIKEPVIHQICSQLPYLLTLKIMLVRWSPLLIIHNYFSYLLMILTLPMKWIKTSLTVSGWTYDTNVGKKMMKCATKKQGSIDPHALRKTRNFITAIGFTGWIQRLEIASWNINIVWNIDSVDCCVCIP